jgi:protein SCO1
MFNSRLPTPTSQARPRANSQRRRRIGAAVRAVLYLGLGSWLCLGVGGWESGVVSAQQQPGMPGSMGHQTGIVASNVPPQFKAVTFQQRLGDKLPLEAPLRDETGRDVVLGEYFGTKPVVLAFVYYQCPMLCNQVMNGISSALKAVPFVPGTDFDVLLVSFDPRDTPEAGNGK